MEDEGEGVGGVDGGDGGEGAGFGRDEGAVGHAADGPGDVGGGEGVVVVEADVGAEVEDPGEGVGLLPGGGEPGLEVEVRVFADERIVDEIADALGLSVGALAEVEVVGGGLDEESEGVGWWSGCAAGGEGEAEGGRDTLKDAGGHG